MSLSRSHSPSFYSLWVRCPEDWPGLAVAAVVTPPALSPSKWLALSPSKRLASRLTTAATRIAKAEVESSALLRQLCCGRGARTPRVSSQRPMPRGVRAPRLQSPGIGRVLKIKAPVQTFSESTAPRLTTAASEKIISLPYPQRAPAHGGAA